MEGSRGRMASRAGERSAAAARAQGDVDPAFHRAILKIALELRKPGALGYEAVVAETIRAMRLDAGAFRRHLGENGARNMSLLLSAARRLGP
jgi:CRP-like cAMP-binding protein